MDPEILTHRDVKVVIIVCIRKEHNTKSVENISHLCDPQVVIDTIQEAWVSETY